MTTDLQLRRRFFAEEVQALADLKTPGLVEALAAIRREAFLGPGPWLVQAEASGPRHTPDSDPRHVYHTYSIAIDADRQLFNGSPVVLGGAIDALELRAGHRVLHVGAGLGYYTAVIALTVGVAGKVVAVEIDPSLAATARQNLASMPWVEIRQGDGTGALECAFDAILVNAGVTHPQPTWLEALAAGGRLLLPLTATMPAMGPLGKGFMVLLTKEDGDAFAARPLAMTAIYSAVGLRDDALNVELGRAMMRGVRPTFARFRRDRHAPGPGCWYHSRDFCFSAA